MRYKKIIFLIFLSIVSMLNANEIPFQFYSNTELKASKVTNNGKLRIFFKDVEGLSSEFIEGKIWHYEYSLNTLVKKSFFDEVKSILKSMEATLLYYGDDYIYFKFYNKDILYWGKMVYFKGQYTIELLEEKPLKVKSLIKNMILKNLTFDSNKAVLKKEAEGEIARISQFLQKNSTYMVEIQGHTDSVGDAKANLILSQKRAEEVRNALIRQGITKERIKAKGYGEVIAIASNNSKEGRRKNRRVELKVLSK